MCDVIIMSRFLLTLLTLGRSADLAGSFNVWLCSPEARFLKNKLVWANWDVDEMKEKAQKIQDSPFFTISLAGWPVMPDI